MRVVTPAMKLDVRIDDATANQGLLKLSGLAGILPCEVTLTPAELRRLLLRVLRPRTLALLLKK
ncbi:hypothetical protein GCM10011487_48750 [Steroidobacter agaridevorans]|uniref:Uncharacterized protein n=1 Tax=Steroidobacter agaridevorans TaxID=2695856 RepID=A0A829YHG5_9GAMM|nr:hypothetical protein [Steroidobacter agaridevorans]GFE82875.1 hypothetical protein GCM10011487_48750 [Steroidobacter agaridevorans]GFE85965.1 hypothetical protein GCM10011488_09190 [Steroidobacter agaridevorans]